MYHHSYRLYRYVPNIFIFWNSSPFLCIHSTESRLCTEKAMAFVKKKQKNHHNFAPEKPPEFCLGEGLGWGSGRGSLDNIADEIAEQLT